MSERPSEYERPLLEVDNETRDLPAPNRNIFPVPKGFPYFEVSGSGRGLPHNFATEEDAREYIRLLREQGKFKGGIQLHKARGGEPGEYNMIKLDNFEIK